MISSINYFQEVTPADKPIMSFPDPVIDFPTKNLYMSDLHLPKSIAYPQQFHVTVGRLDQSSNSLPERSGFLPVEPMTMINDIQPSVYRGIYIEQSSLPFPNPDTIESLPTNYEMDLNEQVYYDGSRLSGGLSEQLAIQRQLEAKQAAIEREMEIARRGIETIRSQTTDQYVNTLNQERRAEFERFREAIPSGRLDIIKEVFKSRELIAIQKQEVLNLRDRLELLQIRKSPSADEATLELKKSVQVLEESLNRLNRLNAELGQETEKVEAPVETTVKEEKVEKETDTGDQSTQGFIVNVIDDYLIGLDLKEEENQKLRRKLIGELGGRRFRSKKRVEKEIKLLVKSFDLL